jgi:hypothetical protein
VKLPLMSPNEGNEMNEIKKQIERLFIKYGTPVTIREIELIGAIVDDIIDREMTAAFQRGYNGHAAEIRALQD